MSVFKIKKKYTHQDVAYKCMECDKQYLRQRDLNHHIHEKHELHKVHLHKMPGLVSFTRPYTLTEHFKKDCQAKVYSEPIIAVQSINECLMRENYTISTRYIDSMPQLMQATNS